MRNLQNGHPAGWVTSRVYTFFRMMSVIWMCQIFLFSLFHLVFKGLDSVNAKTTLVDPELVQTHPDPNGVSVSRSTSVSITYDQVMDPATVSTNTFPVYGMQTGLLSGNYSVMDGVVQFVPAHTLKPGEWIQVTATTGTHSLAGQSPLTPTIWGFWVETIGGSGVFTETGQDFDPASHTESVALADLDGDQDLDAFIGNNDEKPDILLVNDGFGFFSDSGQQLGNSNTRAVALGDLDADRDMDAFIAIESATVGNQVWFNSGGGVFTNSGQSLGDSLSASVALGDLDGDGDLDAFVGNWDVAPNRVWLNDGNGLFSPNGQSQGLGNSDSYSVSLGDLDSDGDLDAFVANLGQANKIWWNNGHGIFSDSGQNLGNASSWSAALGDLDSDGDLDAFVANTFSEPNKVWRNDGNGVFTDSNQFLGTSDSQAVVLGDLDSDGDLDAFVGNVDQPDLIWTNEGDGEFTASDQALENSATSSIALGDMDSDGDLDAFVSNWEPDPSKPWVNFSQYPLYLPFLNGPQ